ncbi:LysR family transcriptional regulator [Virgibacillus sp. W0181]|uniref:LysR family transcriptional regulator n=1 Tax=Virgibacillus sp. W0181 TaxID=3391581 RepID=UPI003F484E1D
MDNHLHVFITVAEKQNFSRAAESLHMTQPAVSQYIRAFENHIGTRLLERTNKFVRLNKAGEIVYHHGKEIVGLYTKMQTLVDDLTNHAHGALSIGASYTFGEYVLPKLLAHMQMQYADIIPEVTIGNTTTIAHLVSNHQLDIGIVEGKVTESGFIEEPFAEDEMVVVAPANHSLARKVRVEGKELETEPWIVREAGSGTREVTDKIFRVLNISPGRVLHFSSTQLIKEAVEAGMGLSVMSKWAIQRELKTEALRIVPIEKLPLKRQFSFIRKSPFQTKALKVFMDLLRDNRFKH